MTGQCADATVEARCARCALSAGGVSGMVSGDVTNMQRHIAHTSRGGGGTFRLITPRAFFTHNQSPPRSTGVELEVLGGDQVTLTVGRGAYLISDLITVSMRIRNIITSGEG